MDILEIGGEVETPKKFDFTSLHSLPNQIENVSEVLPGKEGAAVSLQSILDHVGATGAARKAHRSDRAGERPPFPSLSIDWSL